MFDEPGQHSMAVDSQHALLKQLASETSLQSIVAASFDEAEEVFRQATQGIKYTLIEWDGKLYGPNEDSSQLNDFSLRSCDSGLQGELLARECTGARHC